MAITILRKYYEAIRSTFKSLAMKWNGVNEVIKLNGKSPSWVEYSGYEQGRLAYLNKGTGIVMNESIPDSIKCVISKEYEGEEDEVYPVISEESTRIHTLGNENYIRDAIIELNTLTHNNIGFSEGLTKQELTEKGMQIATDLSALQLTSENLELQDMFNADNGVKAYSQLSNRSDDVYNGTQLLTYPHQTSAVDMEPFDAVYYTDTSEIDEIGVELTESGTYSYNIAAGTYEIWICGGGGGGGGSAGKHAWVGSNGGSAAAFHGEMKLDEGELTIVVGTAGSGGVCSGRNAYPGTNGTSSTITLGSTTIITAGFGYGGYGTGKLASSNTGAGGTLTINSSANVVSSTIRSNGVSYSTVSILGNGYGAGGRAAYYSSGTNGTGGYCKIVLKSYTNESYRSISDTDVLTYDVNKNYVLDESEYIKYEDLEELESVLNKISICLGKRDSWFDTSGRCQLTCQVSCQHTCQLSCQGCNRKQCHNQHCGSM